MFGFRQYLGKIKDENASSYYWRSSLPVLRSYHTDPKFTAFGILDVLSTVPKKDMVEEEKPVEEPKNDLMRRWRLSMIWRQSNSIMPLNG